jgi:hypothetical protein
MRFGRPLETPGALAATITSMLLIAQQVAGKAARDALFCRRRWQLAPYFHCHLEAVAPVAPGRPREAYRAHRNHTAWGLTPLIDATSAQPAAVEAPPCKALEALKNPEALLSRAHDVLFREG